MKVVMLNLAEGIFISMTLQLIKTESHYENRWVKCDDVSSKVHFRRKTHDKVSFQWIKHNKFPFYISNIQSLTLKLRNVTEDKVQKLTDLVHIRVFRVNTGNISLLFTKISKFLFISN